MTPLLEVRDLRVRFPRPDGVARAVDGVGFRIGPGEAVGLVGESGCGKTVTALALMGLVPLPGRISPESSVRFRDQELVGASRDALRRVRGGGMAMVFQDPRSSLNPVLRVGAQVAEVARRHHPEESSREVERRSLHLLEEVGLSEPRRLARAYPHELSGGMRQRVALAAALAGDPDLLVADEPTTALDVTIQARFLELLRRLRDRRGLAVLLITHDLAVVAEVCHRVLVMYAGRIVESGEVEEALRSPAHPYTRGLRASVPSLEGGAGPLPSIPGSVPSPVAPPEGCRFHPRCPHAWERCLDEPPLLPDGGDEALGTRARCWLVDEPRRRREDAPW